MGDRPLDHRDIRESRDCHHLSHVSQTFGIKLGRIHMPRGTDTACQRDRKCPITRTTISDACPKFVPRAMRRGAPPRQPSCHESVVDTADCRPQARRRRQVLTAQHDPQSQSMRHGGLPRYGAWSVCRRDVTPDNADQQVRQKGHGPCRINFSPCPALTPRAILAI